MLTGLMKAISVISLRGSGKRRFRPVDSRWNQRNYSFMEIQGDVKVCRLFGDKNIIKKSLQDIYL
jgi:hypothetical protein